MRWSIKKQNAIIGCDNMIMKALVACIVASCCWAIDSVSSQTSTTREYVFNAWPTYIPLLLGIGNNTQIHQTWPKQELRVDLPDLIQAVSVRDDDMQDDPTLMGPPIHVKEGDRLKLTLHNQVPHTGLSVHLHGFGYNDHFEFDGAVGVSQCPLAEGNSFVYDVQVNERPGTYWYYTSLAGHFGVDAYDAIRGPLIVHPGGSEDLVDGLNTFPLPSGYLPLSYENERILFFQDGSLSGGRTRYLQHVGGLLPPPSKNKDGIIVSTSPWEFGTCNGKLRDIIHVAPNQTFKFRVINGGQHHALRFSIDGFPLTVTAADSQLIEPFTVDKIVLNVGERFDVEVILQDIQVGRRFWIRADTLERQDQGFQNGIRAILRVSDFVQELPSNEDVPDPLQSIESHDGGTKTLNCQASRCIPITTLRPLGNNLDWPHSAEMNGTISELFTVDTHFWPFPQYSHFVSIDGSLMTQNELPPVAMISRSFRPENSVHKNSLGLRASSRSSVIIVWRTALLMDVPIHLHGHSVEILDITYPDLQQDCNLQSCKLSQANDMVEKLKGLVKIPPGQAIVKDTFVIPAGGAIVTRMSTGDPGLWKANAIRDIHNEDGLGFVLVVGDYRVPFKDGWSTDFPTCDTALVQSTPIKPACECYEDKNAPFQLNDNHEKRFCSRSHLCRHELSQAANLDSLIYEKGFSIQSGWAIPGGLVTTIFLLVTLTSIVLILVHSQSGISDGGEDETTKRTRLIRRFSSFGSGVLPSHPNSSQRRRSTIDVKVGSSRESMLSMSVVAESHIGTVEHIHEEEVREDSVLGTNDPPPPPDRSNKSESDDESDLGSLDPVQRLHLLRQKSTMSTFERIFSERGNDGMGTTDLRDAFEFLLDGYSVKGKLEAIPVDETVNKTSTILDQVLYIFPMQWSEYFSSSVNLLRFVEVAGLAALTGGIFQNIGHDNSQSTVAELSSLVIVLTTTWTFSRLYFAVHSQHRWFRSIKVLFRQKRFALMPVFLARISVLILCESIFPTLAVFVCFPFAGLMGDIQSLLNISFLLASNNICYIFLGCLIGMLTNMPNAMIAATVFSQASILITGVFAELPASLEWTRYFSPFYWTVQGLLRSVYHGADNYDCVNGSSSEIGANQCFIEYDPLIEQYKRQGLHVALYNNPSTSSVLAESIALVALGFGLHLLIFFRCFFSYYKINWDDIHALWLSCFGFVTDNL